MLVANSVTRGVVLGSLFLVLISPAIHANQRANPNVSEEENLFIQIIKKATEEPLSSTDLSSLKYVLKNYNSKTNLSFTKQDVEAMVKMNLENSRYNYELGRCLLNSLDQKRPIISEELKRLRDQMQRSGTHKSKLDADFAKIVSASNGTTWVDESGRRHAPLQRADVLAGLATLKVATANMEQITRIVKELSGEPLTPSQVKPLTPSQLASSEFKKMVEALNASQQAAYLINTGSGDAQLGLRGYGNINKIAGYRRTALEIGLKTDIQVLNSVYPELGTRFHNDFLSAMDTFLKAYQSNSSELLKRFGEENDRWADWYQANRGAIQAAADKAILGH